MVDVVIPVYRPDGKLVHLLRRLEGQTVKPNKILLIHTQDVGQGRDDKEEWEKYAERLDNVTVVPIRKEEYDHGGTRNLGASLTDSPYVLFMTQDAVPCGDGLVEALMGPMSDVGVAAVYARQLPHQGAGIIERYTRRFNYPKQSRRKTRDDIGEMGIKTFFCSNVCAAYRRETLEEVGGFVRRTIFNEDMILAHALIMAGYVVHYAADAKVAHSHQYGYREQFRRNFDMAVSHREYPAVFASVPPESEGVRLVKDTARYLVRKGKAHLIPDLVLMSAFKYLGYRVGLHYDKLPHKLVKGLSMNPSYWGKR